MAGDVRGARFSVPLLASANSSPRNVVLHCTHGEVIVAGVFSVSERDQAITYNVVSTNRPDASRTGLLALR